jgi:hypothetical protein
MSGMYISHLYSNRDVIQKSKAKNTTPKKYETKEFSFLCHGNIMGTL